MVPQNQLIKSGCLTDMISENPRKIQIEVLNTSPSSTTEFLAENTPTKFEQA